MDPNTSIPQGENNSPQPIEQTPQSLGTEQVAPKETFVPPVQIQDNSDVPSTPVAPQTPTMPNSPEPAKKNSPILIVAIILMLIAVLAAGGYLLWLKYFSGSGTTPTPTPIAIVTASPTPDPTANWKTYGDQQSKFTFKYPTDWTRSENSVVSNITPTLPTYRDSGSDYYVISTTFIDQNFSSWRDPRNQGQSSNYTSGVLNGYQTHSAYDTPGQTPGYEILIEYGNKMVEFDLFPYDRSYPDPKIIEIFDQILSTFKFIETTPTATSVSSPSATAKP